MNAAQCHLPSAATGFAQHHTYRHPQRRRQQHCRQRHWRRSKSRDTLCLLQTTMQRQITTMAAWGNSRWRVRQLAKDELMWAAQVQFEGFHTPQKFMPLDALSRMTFRAEVVSTLKQKLQYNTPDSFACLVAERTNGDRTTVGVADVSLQSDKEVLRKLPEAVEQYAYLSSMAVDSALRRQGAAQALLSAAEQMAGTWKQRYLALHLHTDNTPALRLYRRAGFEEVDRVSPFLGRPRILMVKTVRR